jgi:hypothetical protein
MAQKNKVSPTGNNDDVAPQGKVTLAQLQHEQKPNGRLCWDLDKFIIHKESIKPSKHGMRSANGAGRSATRNAGCAKCRVTRTQKKEIARGSSVSFICTMR